MQPCECYKCRTGRPRQCERKSSTATMRVSVEIDADTREAFARYLGRAVSDDEIRERLADVLKSYLQDTIRNA